MNLSQLKNLEEGSKVKYMAPFPGLETGKVYTVENTAVGRLIRTSDGLGFFLFQHELYQDCEVIEPSEQELL